MLPSFKTTHRLVWDGRIIFPLVKKQLAVSYSRSVSKASTGETSPHVDFRVRMGSGSSVWDVANCYLAVMNFLHPPSITQTIQPPFRSAQPHVCSSPPSSLHLSGVNAVKSRQYSEVAIKYSEVASIQWSRVNTVKSRQYSEVASIQWSRVNTVKSRQYSEVASIQWSRVNTVKSRQYSEVASIQWSRVNTVKSRQYSEVASIQWSRVNTVKSRQYSEVASIQWSRVNTVKSRQYSEVASIQWSRVNAARSRVRGCALHWRDLGPNAAAPRCSATGFSSSTPPSSSSLHIQTNTSLRDKLNLSRSQNKVCSHAYNACSQLSRLHRMYHFQHTDIVFRQTRLFSNQFLSVDR